MSSPGIHNGSRTDTAHHATARRPEPHTAQPAARNRQNQSDHVALSADVHEVEGTSHAASVAAAFGAHASEPGPRPTGQGTAVAQRAQPPTTNGDRSQPFHFENQHDRDLVRRNVEEARSRSDLDYGLRLAWFREQVRNHGPQDLKQTHPGVYGDRLGNYNYGAVGQALGLTPTDILQGAGRAQVAAGTSRPEYGLPGNLIIGGGTGSYGDDPNDQRDIRQGMAEALQYQNGRATHMGAGRPQNPVGDAISAGVNGNDAARAVRNAGLLWETVRANRENPGAPVSPTERARQAELTRASGEHRGAARQLIASNTQPGVSLGRPYPTMPHTNVDGISRHLAQTIASNPSLADQVIRQLGGSAGRDVARSLTSGMNSQQLQALANTPEGAQALRGMRDTLTSDYMNLQLDYRNRADLFQAQRLEAAIQDGQGSRSAHWTVREGSRALESSLHQAYAGSHH